MAGLNGSIDLDESAAFPYVPNVLDRLGFPKVGNNRGFVAATAIDTLGTGIWVPVSIIYFLRTTQLSLSEVGLAVSIGSVVALPMVLIAGQSVDRYGPKKVMQISNLLQLVGFLAYPLAGSLATVAIVVCMTMLGRAAFWGSYGPIVASFSAPGERERWFGFLGAIRNIGFGVGGLIGSFVAAVDNQTVYQATILFNAATFLVSYLILLRVRIDHVPAAAPCSATDVDSGPSGWTAVLKDRGYRLLIVCGFCYGMSCMVLLIILPVYIVNVLALPGWILGIVVAINTGMIGVGQGLMIRRMTGTARATAVVAACSMAVIAYALFLMGGMLSGIAAAVAVVLGAVIYTLAEMTAGPVLEALSAESAPPRMRGRFVSAYQLAFTLSMVVAPGAYAWLLSQGSLVTWATAAILALVCTACTIPMRLTLPLSAMPIASESS